MATGYRTNHQKPQSCMETVIVTVQNKVVYIHSALQSSYSQSALNMDITVEGCAVVELTVCFLEMGMICKLLSQRCYEDEVERLSPCILLKCCCLLRGLGGFLSPVEDKHKDIFREKTSRNSPHIQ